MAKQVMSDSHTMTALAPVCVSTLTAWEAFEVCRAFG
jgi:hypothetical protein